MNISITTAAQAALACATAAREARHYARACRAQGRVDDADGWENEARMYDGARRELHAALYPTPAEPVTRVDLGIGYMEPAKPTDHA